MSTFQPVPTYADPVLVDEKSGKSGFNPVWLSWFLTLTNGSLAGTVAHNSTTGLQGGATGEYYHITQDQAEGLYVRSTGAAFTITPSASPFTYQNTAENDVDVILAGTVTSAAFSRDGTTFFSLPTSGMFRLSPNDRLKVTYTGTISMEGVPR